MSKQENLSGELSRRNFINSLILSPLLPEANRFFGTPRNLESASYPSPEYLKSLIPNPKTGLVNCPMLADSLYCHDPSEPFLVTVNFSKTYSTSVEDRVNKDPQKFGDLEGYGKGVREAITRGAPVFLVLDFPWQRDNRLIASSADWEKYVTGIAELFKGANFILGNEINIPGNFWGNNLNLFTDCFLKAASIIKNTSPGSKILTPGEAYYGHGETLKLLINQLVTQSRGQVPFDGVAFHYYDKASLLGSRITEYKKLLRELGLPKIPLYLTELGKPETAILNNNEQVNALTQELAVALYHVWVGDIQNVFWQTALDPEDKGRHNLVYSDHLEKIFLKPAAYRYWDLIRLLHHKITYTTAENLAFVDGYTSRGDHVVIIWSKIINCWEQQFSNYQGALYSSSDNPGVEGQPQIFFFPSKKIIPPLL